MWSKRTQVVWSRVKKYWPLVSWVFLLLGFIYLKQVSSLLGWLILTTYVFFIWGWDLVQSLFLSLWISALFRQLLVGTWVSVVAARSHPFLAGYAYSFGLQPTYIWLVLLLVFLLFRRHRANYYQLQLTSSQAVLAAMLGWAVVSSLVAPRFALAATGLVSLLVGGIIFLVSSMLFQQLKLRRELKNFMLASLILLGLIGTAQAVLNHSLGILIETRSSFFLNEFHTTDGAPLYRVTGIAPHPTFFASLLALFLLPVLGLALDAHQQNKSFLFKFCLLALILGSVALLATFSRSSWLAVLLMSLILLARGLSFKLAHLKQLQKIVWQKIKNFWYLCLLLGWVGAGFFYQVLDRLGSLATVWKIGNWSGRAELIRHSWQMIKNYPFMGVGLNHFPVAMVQQGVSLQYRSFIFPVHNTFLLFLSELGVIGGGLFIGFVVLVLIRTRQVFQVKANLFELGVWLGLVTFIINAQFHTLFNQDPSFNIFMLLSGYLVAAHGNKPSSRNSGYSDQKPTAKVKAVT